MDAKKPLPAPLAARWHSAAAMLGISYRSVRRLVQAGTLESVKVGNIDVIPMKSINKVLGIDDQAA